MTFTQASVCHVASLSCLHDVSKNFHKFTCVLIRLFKTLSSGFMCNKVQQMLQQSCSLLQQAGKYANVVLLQDYFLHMFQQLQ